MDMQKFKMVEEIVAGIRSLECRIQSTEMFHSKLRSYLNQEITVSLTGEEYLNTPSYYDLKAKDIVEIVKIKLDNLKDSLSAFKRRLEEI